MKPLATSKINDWIACVLNVLILPGVGFAIRGK